MLQIQSENLKKSEKLAQHKLIDDSINERLASIFLNTPITENSEFKCTNFNAANTSTPNDGNAEIKNEQPDNNNYVSIISEAILDEKNLKSNNGSEFNFTEAEENIIKYLSKCDYNRKMSFIKHLGCETESKNSITGLPGTSTHAYPAGFKESVQPPVIPDNFTYSSPQQTKGGAACSVNPTSSKFFRFDGTRNQFNFRQVSVIV